MSHWDEMQDANQTLLTAQRGVTGKSQETNGWFKRSINFKEHKRSTQIHADADAVLSIEAHPNNTTLTMCLEETYKTKSQHRTNSISVTLTQKNIDALEAMLAELKAAKQQAAA